jgi:hypothetical protein
MENSLWLLGKFGAGSGEAGRPVRRFCRGWNLVLNQS